LNYFLHVLLTANRQHFLPLQCVIVSQFATYHLVLPDLVIVSFFSTQLIAIS